MHFKKFSILLSLMCLTLLLSGCFCEHEWENATCFAPKTCSLCDKTEGEPLTHQWVSATCTQPETCSLCSSTQGTALGHTPGEWNTVADFCSAKQHQEQHCTTCSTILGSNDQELATFIHNGLFMFTPKQFMERLSMLISKSYPDFSYEIDSTQDLLYVNILLNTNAPQEYQITFFDANAQPLMRNDFEQENILCVSLNQTNFVSKQANYHILDTDLLNAFCLASDPALTDEDISFNYIMYLTTYLNWTDFGETAGYNEKNGILYEYLYHYLEDTDYRIDISSVLLYASN